MRYTIQESNFFDGYTSGGSDDPKTVIKQWFEAERKNPTCVAIAAKSQKDAYELVLWASEHLDEIKKEHEKGCAYKWKFIEDGILRGVRTQCQDFSGEGDSVSPFTMG